MAADVPPSQRRPYPTAPDPTPPSSWPGPSYLGTDGSRAGRPVIPSTVWLTPVTPPDDRPDDRADDRPDDRDPGLWPTATLAAILAAFSAPGAPVALLPWPARSPASSPANTAASDRAAEPGRLRSTPPRDRGIDAALEAVAAAGGRPILLDLDLTSTTTTPDTITPGMTPPDTTTPATVERIGGVLGGTGDTTGPAAHDPRRPSIDSTPTGPQPAELIVTSVAPSDVDEASAGRVAIAAAQVLRCGGLLLVLTHSDHDDEGRLIEPGGLLVTAAQNADLLYFQHVVTVTAPVRGGRIQLPPATDPPTTDPPARKPACAPVSATSLAAVPAVSSTGREGVGGRHRRVHRDLYVFGQQHDRHTPAGPDLDLPTDPTLDLTKIGVPR